MVIFFPENRNSPFTLTQKILPQVLTVGLFAEELLIFPAMQNVAGGLKMRGMFQKAM